MEEFQSRPRVRFLLSLKFPGSLTTIGVFFSPLEGSFCLSLACYPVDSVAPLMNTTMGKQEDFDALIRRARIKSSWPSGPGFHSALKDGSGKSYAIPPFTVSIGSRSLSYLLSTDVSANGCRPVSLLSFSMFHRQLRITLSISPKVRSRVRTHIPSKTTIKACPAGCLQYTFTHRRLHTSTLPKQESIELKNGLRH